MIASWERATGLFFKRIGFTDSERTFRSSGRHNDTGDDMDITANKFLNPSMAFCTVSIPIAPAIAVKTPFR